MLIGGPVLFAIGFAWCLSALAVLWHVRDPATSAYQLQRTWALSTEVAARLATAVLGVHLIVVLSVPAALGAVVLRGPDARSAAIEGSLVIAALVASGMLLYTITGVLLRRGRPCGCGVGEVDLGATALLRNAVFMVPPVAALRSRSQGGDTQIGTVVEQLTMLSAGLACAALLIGVFHVHDILRRASNGRSVMVAR